MTNMWPADVVIEQRNAQEGQQRIAAPTAELAYPEPIVGVFMQGSCRPLKRFVHRASSRKLGAIIGKKLVVG